MCKSCLMFLFGVLIMLGCIFGGLIFGSTVVQLTMGWIVVAIVFIIGVVVVSLD